MIGKKFWEALNWNCSGRKVRERDLRVSLLIAVDQLWQKRADIPVPLLKFRINSQEAISSIIKIARHHRTLGASTSYLHTDFQSAAHSESTGADTSSLHTLLSLAQNKPPSPSLIPSAYSQCKSLHNGFHLPPHYVMCNNTCEIPEDTHVVFPT